MAESLFFSNVTQNEKNESILKMLFRYSEETSTQVYVIDAPLGTDKTDKYEYTDGIIVLIPDHKICLLNVNDAEDECFQDFYDDFTEDLGYLSEKYDYRRQLGRPRVWKNKFLIKLNIGEFNGVDDLICHIRLQDKFDQRNSNFLISLLIGSINDINRIGGKHPDTVLDQIKKKIILFDGEQSRFVYSQPSDKKRIVIQGLAGTGKTELLLHKLKDTYTQKKDKKIVFTCYNKILAQSMKKRIPDFFDFMRVEEQIQWDKRLFVMHSWGTKGQTNTGVYSYICSTYNLNFHPFSQQWNFDAVCVDAINNLKKMNDFQPCFDYMFIDESQDFPQSFFELCELVTKYVVYVAGDIFQDIYDRTINQSVKSDFLLNKCYRTDPKTLMFAHAVGMGLYEEPVIRWLEDEEWSACGYVFERSGENFILSRHPLRRFEDLDTSTITNIELYGSSNKCVLERIFNVIDEIRERHKTVCANDIAVVFLESNNRLNYEFADALAFEIPKRYAWHAVKGYETKDSTEDAVFISNRNNIKGLEYPFVICVSCGKITENIFDRNALYMILTRSFITSYFIINEDNVDFINRYSIAAKNIDRTGTMLLREPPESEKEQQNQKITIAAQREQKSFEDIVKEALNELPGLSNQNKKIIISAMIAYTNDVGVMSEPEIKERTRKMASGFI